MKESKTSFFGAPSQRGTKIERRDPDGSRSQRSQEIDDQLEEILENLRKEAEEKSLKVGMEKKNEDMKENVKNLKSSLEEKKENEDQKDLHDKISNNNNNSKLHRLPNPKSLRSLLSPSSPVS